MYIPFHTVSQDCPTIGLWRSVLSPIAEFLYFARTWARAWRQDAFRPLHRTFRWIVYSWLGWSQSPARQGQSEVQQAIKSIQLFTTLSKIIIQRQYTDTISLTIYSTAWSWYNLQNITLRCRQSRRKYDLGQTPCFPFAEFGSPMTPVLAYIHLLTLKARARTSSTICVPLFARRPTFECRFAKQSTFCTSAFGLYGASSVGQQKWPRPAPRLREYCYSHSKLRSFRWIVSLRTRLRNVSTTP